jgi:lipopolysaccharide/colanic/teichoic acid biosynthesis glycosyltransferase
MLMAEVKTISLLEKYILEVRPGITDFSSLEYINLDEIVGSENPDLEYETKVLCNKNRLRMKYIENIRFKTDIYIFLKTIFGVLKKIINYLYRSLNGKSKIKK